MAATLSGLHASASLGVAVCRSCQSYKQQQQQNSVNVLCTSSSQLCRQGVLSGSSRVTKVGFRETRNHAQVSYFLKPKKSLRLRTAAVAELQALSSDELTENSTEQLQLPDIFSSEAGNPPIDLPTQFGDATGLRQDAIQQAAESSSAFVTGDVPALPPATDDVPSLLDGIDSTLDPDSALDVLKSAGEDGSAGYSILNDSDEYTRLTQGGFENLKTNDLGDAIKAIQDAFKDAQYTATNSVESLVTAFRDAVDSAGSSFQNTYESINGSILKSIKSVSGTNERGLDNLDSSVETPRVDVDFTSVFRVGTPANESLKGFVTVVKTTTGSALEFAGSTISVVYTSAKDNLPEDLQSFLDTAEEKVSLVSGLLGSTIEQALIIIGGAEKSVGIDPDNPAVTVTVVAGGSVFLGLAYFNLRYGGYSGDLLPSAALGLLKSERNVVLVDIRSQEVRDRQGLPDLRRSTRSKFASVEFVKVDGTLRGQLKNVKETEAALTAAVIGNLKNVNRSSKIIVLDENGGQSKKIARGLRRNGFRESYLVDGGFKAWSSSGLPSKADGPENALIILQQDAEAIVEEVNPTPFTVLAVLAGSLAGLYALLEWERALQLVGVLGLVTTIYSRVESYEDLEDAKADLRLLQKPFNLAIQGILWVTGSEPKKLQLATSPVSSNVQGRVIQAAAKHGPIPSELELVQDPAQDPVRDESDVAAVESSVVPVVDGVAETDDSSQSQHTSLQEPQ